MTLRCFISFSMILTISASPPVPPNPEEKVSTARWMANHISWGVLSTTSTRSEETAAGEPFGNPYSFADADTGTPYFYATDMDASMIDLFTAKHANPRATFALSEASLHNRTSNATQATCRIGASTYSDPENPPCARLVLSGTMTKVKESSHEYSLARAALFKRHPSFQLYPKWHAFYIAKLVVDGVWLIDFYGGAAIIPPAKYLAANSSVGGGWPQRYTEVPPRNDLNVRPNPAQKPQTARWMAANLNWGVLSTTSSRSEGTTVGDPFGNPYSFAEISGVPYFYGSDLDASMTDIFTAKPPHAKASLALSEATLGGSSKMVGSCEIGALLYPFGDPENPPCARLVLSGAVVKVPLNTTEYHAGRAALIARHPSFVNYPASHDFFVAKMELEGVWLIDAYGGAAIISPASYFSANMSADSAIIFA